MKPLKEGFKDYLKIKSRALTDLLNVGQNMKLKII